MEYRKHANGIDSQIRDKFSEIDKLRYGPSPDDNLIDRRIEDTLDFIKKNADALGIDSNKIDHKWKEYKEKGGEYLGFGNTLTDSDIYSYDKGYENYKKKYGKQ